MEMLSAKRDIGATLGRRRMTSAQRGTDIVGHIDCRLRRPDTAVVQRPPSAADYGLMSRAGIVRRIKSNVIT